MIKLNNNLKASSKTIIANLYFSDDKLSKELESFIDKEDFKKGNYFKLINSKDRTLIIGLGSKKDLTSDKLRSIGSKIYNGIRDESDNLIIKSKLDLSDNEVLVQGLLLSTYEFNKYKSKTKKSLLKEFKIECKDETKLVSYYKKFDVIKNNVFLIRDLVNEPSNVINPTTFESITKKLLKNTSLKLKVLDFKELEKNKMGGIISVGKGSKDAPRLLIINYNPLKNDKDHVALVGKGVTFDSGGYNLKPTGYIEEMKQDMAGAATALSTILCAEKLKIKKNMVAYIPLAENMISDNSYRPGDIIKMLSGKTVEVGNTDAEGRLILADALFQAQKTNPKVIIDFATLTGATIIALGNTITSLMTNDDKLYKDFFKASKITGEKIWQLPIYDEHEEAIKSDIADIKNLGFPKGAAGTITAGAFLKQFVNDKPWVHFDIAGTAFSGENKDFLKKGGTGVMLRTMIEWLSK